MYPSKKGKGQDMLTIDLPKKTEKRLYNFAAISGTDKKKIAVGAIEEFLDEIHDASVAQSRAMNPGKTYTIAEAEKMLALQS